MNLRSYLSDLNRYIDEGLALLNNPLCDAETRARLEDVLGQLFDRQDKILNLLNGEPE